MARMILWVQFNPGVQNVAHGRIDGNGEKGPAAAAAAIHPVNHFPMMWRRGSFTPHWLSYPRAPFSEAASLKRCEHIKESNFHKYFNPFIYAPIWDLLNILLYIIIIGRRRCSLVNSDTGRWTKTGWKVGMLRTSQSHANRIAHTTRYIGLRRGDTRRLMTEDRFRFIRSFSPYYGLSDLHSRDEIVLSHAERKPG